MFSEFFISKGLLHLPILAMALFAITFACLVLRTLLGAAPGQRAHDHVASLPLQEPGKVPSASGVDHE